MFKVNNEDSGIFIVNFEDISHLALVFLPLNLSRLMLAGTGCKFRCFAEIHCFENFNMDNLQP